MTQFAFRLAALVCPAVMTFSYRYEGRGEFFFRLVFNVGLLAALATAVTLVLIPAQEGAPWLEQQVPVALNNPTTNSLREMIKIFCCFILGAAAMSYFFARICPVRTSRVLTANAEGTPHAHADDMIVS
jgi:drug/metabolite transporter (DMT)-like permease